MKTNRRSFMKMLLAGGIAGSSLLTLNAATSGKILSVNQSPKETTDDYHLHDMDQENPGPNKGSMALGMVIDLDKCDGCADDKVYSPALVGPGGSKGGYEERCTAACRTMHNVPPEQEWIKVFYRKDNAFNDGYYFPRPCMQCQNPPCVNVCPVGAAFHRPNSTNPDTFAERDGEGDGLVLIKYTRCIGCRTCMAGCPYEVRYFNWSNYTEPNQDLVKMHSPMFATKRTRGTVEKCDFCAHFGYLGKLSGCAAACPKGAIYYGNLKEDVVTNSDLESISVRDTISERNGFRFKEEYNTRPRVYYLPKSGGNS